MLKAMPVNEIMLLMVNKIGILDEIAKAIAEKGINLQSLHGTVFGEKVILRMITDDNLRIMDALTALHYHPFENHAVLVELPHKPGMFKHVLDRLMRECIEIHHIYATSIASAETTSIILSCSKNDQAVVLLNE